MRHQVIAPDTRRLQVLLHARLRGIRGSDRADMVVGLYAGDETLDGGGRRHMTLH